MDDEYYSYIKKWFDRWAPIYDVIDIPLSGVRDKVVDFTDAKKDSRILDVATGTGRQAFAFGKRGYEVIGIDLSENMLKVANKKNKYENVKFKAADALNIPFEDRYFDVSSVSFALHEMPLSIREKVLREIVRVTKPKGTIVIVDYALPKNKIGRFLIYHFVKSYEGNYYSEFIKSDIRALLRKSEIKIEKEHSVLLGAGGILKGIRVDNDVK
jgi:demethylmenaquinone methyltransferase/2-methoxy-6-polyprenyl-1,4-benzoquinol methylase